MSDLYAAPESSPKTSTQDVPEDILKKIKFGWIAALISTLLTALVVTISIITNANQLLVNVWSYFDVGLMVILTFGMYKKSRVAATIMLIYFALSKIFITLETGKVNGLFLGILFLYLYLQAVIATFKYHAILKQDTPAASL